MCSLFLFVDLLALESSSRSVLTCPQEHRNQNKNQKKQNQDKEPESPQAPDALSFSEVFSAIPTTMLPRPFVPLDTKYNADGNASYGANQRYETQNEAERQRQQTKPELVSNRPDPRPEKRTPVEIFEF